MKNQLKTCFPETIRSLFTVVIALFLTLSLGMVSCEKILPIVNQEDEYEPNNTLDEAFVVVLGTEYDAKISQTDDDDYYKFETAHSNDTYDEVQISVTNVSSDLFIKMELYSADGQSLASEGTTTGGQTLTYNLATPGASYYVRFSGWDGYVNDHGSMGSYTLSISNLDANDEFAPNHTINTAEESLEYGSSYNGVIVSRYEDDFYKFTNPMPGVWNSYTISLTNISESLFGFIEVFKGDKSSIYTNGQQTAGADLAYTLITKEDEFYIRVGGWDGYVNEYGSRGAYSITVVNNGNDDYEPDDTFENARDISTFPTNLNGTILATAASNNDGDYEFFKVAINDQKKVSWAIDPVASNTELHFTVYDPNLTSMGNIDGVDGQTITGSMNNNTGANSFIYIKLGAFIGDNGNYSISFTESSSD
jgi:hypothetical protein